MRRCGALAAALRRAEARGVAVEERLPDLIAGRSLADAEDLAAVLHDRVSRWTASTSTRSGRGELIASLIQFAEVEDPDVQRALDERAKLIEQRAQALIGQAVRDGAPWARKLGRPPTDPARRAAWVRAAKTVAAYVDRHDPTHGGEPTRDETEIVRTATATARRLSEVGTTEPRLEAPTPPPRRVGL